MSQNPAEMTPKEIDQELARIYTASARVESYLVAAKRSAARSERNAAAEAGRISDYESRIAAYRHEASPFNAEYRARRWQRYFLVDNTGGHVHRGMNCSTCFPTTTYDWLIDLADCDEAAMIEEWGEKACTVCFPEAPANPSFHRPSRRDAAAQAARTAETEARQAAKAAKAITDTDGGPLKDGNGYTLKTKIAARNELSQLVQYSVYYGAERYQAHIDRIAAALDAAGMDSADTIAKATKKARKEAGK